MTARRRLNCPEHISFTKFFQRIERRWPGNASAFHEIRRRENRLIEKRIENDSGNLRLQRRQSLRVLSVISRNI